MILKNEYVHLQRPPRTNDLQSVALLRVHLKKNSKKSARWKAEIRNTFSFPSTQQFLRNLVAAVSLFVLPRGPRNSSNHISASLAGHFVKRTAVAFSEQLFGNRLYRLYIKHHLDWPAICVRDTEQLKYSERFLIRAALWLPSSLVSS